MTDETVAMLPGGHTSKRIDDSLLRSRDVDALVLLAYPPHDELRSRGRAPRRADPDRARLPHRRALADRRRPRSTTSCCANPELGRLRQALALWSGSRPSCTNASRMARESAKRCCGSGAMAR